MPIVNALYAPSKKKPLNSMLMLGERSLHYDIQQYLVHDHTERNHQSLGNYLIAPELGVERHTGQVVRRERLSGLLRYYYREAV
jgi:hypothetical protein